MSNKERMRGVKRRDAESIAKLIRKSIKKAVKKGLLPSDLEVSVKYYYESWGQSIELTWSAPKTTLFTIDCGCKKNYYKRGHVISDSCRKSDSFYLKQNATYTEIEEELRSVMDSYNNDDSRYEVYNEDKIFYGQVEFDSWQKITPVNLKYPSVLAELIIGLWNGGLDRDLRDAFMQAEMLLRLSKRQR
jgi:hypothetical protein